MVSSRPTCTECGWTGSPTTPGRVAFSLSQHSCEKYRAKLAAHERGLARHAAVDRTPKPCTHKYADHQHATYACYTLDQCRCDPCSAAQSSYEQKRVRAHAYGRYTRLVDAGPVREHVQALIAGGMGLKRVGQVAGVSHGSLSLLIYGRQDRLRQGPPSKRISADVAAKLRAVQVDLSTLSGGARVDSLGAVRRLRALVVLGWSQSKLCDRLGMTRANFGHLMQGSSVTVTTARAVIELYDRLWNTAPPLATHRDRLAASRSRNYAAAHDWQPPLFWDDDTIDNPEPVLSLVPELDLDEVLVERLMAGTERVQLRTGNRDVPGELIEAVRRLTVAGVTDLEIRRLTGVSTPSNFRTNHGITAQGQIVAIASRGQHRSEGGRTKRSDGMPAA